MNSPRRSRAARAGDRRHEIALPLAGALLGASLDGPDSTHDTYATGGLVVGALAATAIDALWIAQVPAGSSTPAWIPQVAVGHGGLGLGLAGGF